MPIISFPPRLPSGRTFDVVGLGANACDHLVQVPRHPAAGEKVRFRAYHREGGGQTATALVAMQRLGVRTCYIGGVGDDDEGRDVLAELAREGVDVSMVRVRPGGLTQRALILVDADSGERTIVWGRSEGMVVSAEEIVPDQIEAGRILHTDAQDPRAAACAARVARAAGMPVMTDLEPVRPGLDELLPEVDFLICSAEFPERATGRPDLAEALGLLHERTRGGTVMATLGEGGVALLRGDGLAYFPAYRVAAIDTTGAGDVFHGGFAVAMVMGLELGEAIDFAQAVAAMKCLHPGGRSGLPRDREAVLAFQRKTPRREGG